MGASQVALGLCGLTYIYDLCFYLGGWQISSEYIITFFYKSNVLHVGGCNSNLTNYIIFFSNPKYSSIQ